MCRQTHTKPYEVHTALRDDLNEGWVWVKDSSLTDQLQFQRRVIRIQADNKKVYCEALYADKYYVDLLPFRRHLSFFTKRNNFRDCRPILAALDSYHWRCTHYADW